MDAGGSAEAVPADATSELEALRLFDLAFTERHDIAVPDLVVFNAGNNRKLNFRELTAQQFEDFWRVGCFAGFLVGREAARRMVPLGRGTVIFTGASGSLRGKPGFAHFAAAKAGLRMLSQSMAREFGPQGLHIAHVVIDGAINGDRIRSAMPACAADLGELGLLGLEAYWSIHRQPPTAWTQEMDLRPLTEQFQRRASCRARAVALNVQRAPSAIRVGRVRHRSVRFSASSSYGDLAGAEMVIDRGRGVRRTRDAVPSRDAKDVRNAIERARADLSKKFHALTAEGEVV